MHLYAAIFGWKPSSARRRLPTGQTIVLSPNLDHLLEREAAARRCSPSLTPPPSTRLARRLRARRAQGTAVKHPGARAGSGDSAGAGDTHALHQQQHLSDRPTEHSKVTDGLQKLHHAGHALHPDTLAAQALRCNWRGSAALAPRNVTAETLAAGASACVRCTYPTFVSVWEAAGRTA